MNNKKSIVLIILLGIAIYLKSLGNTFVLDDNSQIVNNPLIYSLSNIPKLFLGSSFGGGTGLQGIYYKPLMTSIFAIFYHFFGGNTLPYHLFQLTIHIANGILIFYLLKKFFNQNLSLILSLIFISHPINTEAVVYISALQDTLFLFFGLAGMLIITRPILKLKHYLLYFLLLTLALLSKDTGILFIFVGIFYKLIFSKKDFLKFLTANLILFGTYLGVRSYTVGLLPIAKDIPFSIMRASLIERLTTVPAIVFYYLKIFFFPKDMAVAQMWTVKSLTFNNFVLPLLIDALFISALIVVAQKLRTRASKYLHLFIFFLIWFLLGLSLHLNIFPLDATATDRWFYFPVIGLLGILGVIIQEYFLKNNLFKKQLLILSLILIAILSVLSFVRANDWKNGLTLAEHDVKINQNSFALENNLGYELVGAGRYEEALIHEQKSTELAPWWWLNWNNLGIIYRHLGDQNNDLTLIIKAEQSFTKSTENTSSFYLPYENLAETYLNFEKPEITEKFILDASKKIHLSGNLWFYLSLAEYKLGNKNGATEAAAQALKLNPNNERISQLYQGLLNNTPIELHKPKY
jgi:protein O-mannosyl-transferase